MLEDLIRKNRSCRRFYQQRSVSVDLLKDLVNLARLSASAANLQPLRFILSNHSATNAEIFACLALAAYLKDWQGPKVGEQPAAYIVILGDSQRAKDFGCDHGIAAQSILLGAREAGLGGCMIGAINRKRLRQALDIDPRYKTLLVIALGNPREDVTIEDVDENGDIRYWRDEKGVHHVPKRRLDDVILQVIESEK